MKITVYLGTGGVGKTSVSAATALAMARAGRKALVLTTDPALRLRTALGLQDGRLEQRVPLEPSAPGELWAALLDVRATLDEAVRSYANPALAGRILNHPIYAAIADSLVGMPELMAVERIDQLHRRGFEHIVIDTAPSRHAIEFLDKPMFFAELTESTWVKLLGRTYRFVAGTGMAKLGRRTVDVYARVEAILGPNLVSQVLDFYSIFVSIAEGYSSRAQKTLAVLKDPRASEFRVVTTPQKALRDARFFTGALESRNFPVGACYVNRVWEYSPEAHSPGGLAGRVLDWYGSVRDAHLRAVRELTAGYSGRIRHIGTLPEMQCDVDGIASLEILAKRLEAV